MKMPSGNETYIGSKADNSTIYNATQGNTTRPETEAIRHKIVNAEGVKTSKDNADKHNEPKNNHPVSDFESLLHLLQNSIGSGILAMPVAFVYSGLWFGLVGTVILGTISTYSVHSLVKCAHILKQRHKISELTFADIAERSFLDVPSLAKWSRFMRILVNSFLVFDLVGGISVYLVFVAENVKQVIEYYTDGSELNIRLWIVIVTIPTIILCLVRSLKYLVPFSMIGNILMFAGIGITFQYVLTDLPSPSERIAITSVKRWPMFFDATIYAFESIGVMIALENDMENPKHFIGVISVLNIGMGLIIILFSSMGFFSYLKFGTKTASSITLNLPIDQSLTQSVKIMMALAIFLTITLQFYVPIQIIWNAVKGKISEKSQNLVETALRVFFVIVCGAFAVALPDLELFISLTGAVSSYSLNFIIPAVVELAVYHSDPGYGRYNWRKWTNIVLIALGSLGSISGLYDCFLEYAEENNRK